MQENLQSRERVGVQADASRLGKSIRAVLQPTQREFLQGQRLAVASSVGANGQVWASLLSGEPGFIQVVDEQTVLIDVVPTEEDPLWANLREKGPLGLLVINPAIQKRVRVNGIGERRPDGKLALHVQQAFGNCPRYIQVRQPEVTTPLVRSTPEVKHGTALTSAYQDWITQADTFFIATSHPHSGADASHRGGNPGFVRVLDAHTLVWPDYNGNGMFQTLGNITINPQVGLLFIDFRDGRTLQLSGEARIVWDANYVSQFVGAERVVTFSCVQVIELAHILQFRWELVEYSQHNPR